MIRTGSGAKRRPLRAVAKPRPRSGVSLRRDADHCHDYVVRFLIRSAHKGAIIQTRQATCASARIIHGIAARALIEGSFARRKLRAAARDD